LPGARETPTITVEFVSRGKANQHRDYVTKRAEYQRAGVRKYWIVDRFKRQLTVVRFRGAKAGPRTFDENAVYTTPLLPGFQVPLARLFELADRWDNIVDE